MALLEVERVHKSFGGLKATNDVSFSVEPGEIVSIIGPNGAGKSTIFNLITGVYRPDAGDIRFEGRSIVGKRPNQIVDLGIARTFQNLRKKLIRPGWLFRASRSRLPLRSGRTVSRQRR